MRNKLVAWMAVLAWSCVAASAPDAGAKPKPRPAKGAKSGAKKTKSAPTEERGDDGAESEGDADDSDPKPAKPAKPAKPGKLSVTVATDNAVGAIGSALTQAPICSTGWRVDLEHSYELHIANTGRDGALFGSATCDVGRGSVGFALRYLDGTSYASNGHRANLGAAGPIRVVHVADLNKDKVEDYLIGVESMSGMGPQGAIPRVVYDVLLSGEDTVDTAKYRWAEEYQFDAMQGAKDLKDALRRLKKAKKPRKPKGEDAGWDE
jgi:hypothetical protein